MARDVLKNQVKHLLKQVKMKNLQPEFIHEVRQFEQNLMAAQVSLNSECFSLCEKSEEVAELCLELINLPAKEKNALI